MHAIAVLVKLMQKLNQMKQKKKTERLKNTRKMLRWKDFYGTRNTRRLMHTVAVLVKLMLVLVVDLVGQRGHVERQGGRVVVLRLVT